MKKSESLRVLGAALLVASTAPAQVSTLPVGPPVSCSGVRPGAFIETSKGGCTMNFVYAGGNGATYVGTAGHCILGDSSFGGESVGEFVNGAIPGDRIARDGDGNEIGSFVYAILTSENGTTRDFSLVRLNPGVPSNPALCHFGGPTGTNASTPTSPVVLHHYGNGLLIGDLLPARTEIALHAANSDEIDAIGAAIFGDSGAGVISSDGRAIGVLVSGGVAVGVGGPGMVHFGDIGITRIAPQVQRAAQMLGTSLTLRTAPLSN